MLSAPQAVEAAVDLEKSGRAEWRRLSRAVRYSRGKQKLPWLPESAEAEYRDLALKSATNWIDLVLRAQTQGLRADAWGSPDEPPMAWSEGWLANAMDARQGAFYRAVAVCGSGWIFLADADDGGVWMRPESAVNVAAAWGDDDEWPERVLRVVQPKKVWQLVDDEATFTLRAAGNGRWTVTDTQPHDLGVTPAVRVVDSFDLLGEPQGEVEPIIPTQDRIVDATFTLQMMAKYGAFPQRWISGLDPSEPLRDADGEVLRDADGQPLMPKIQAYVDSIITAQDPDTRFGTFEAANLGHYVDALEAHIRHLAAVSQTPPHYLLGALVNLSAEALAAAEAGLQRRISQKQTTLAEGLEQALRLASQILGDDAMATDMTAQIHWGDVESRSLSQTSDALLKLRDIGVPLPKLLQMIPGWTATDVQEAVAEAQSQDALAALAAVLEPSATPDALSDLEAV